MDDRELAANTRLVRAMREQLQPGIAVHCEECGEPMLVHDTVKLYCSKRCRNLASMRRVAASMRAIPFEEGADRWEKL